MSYNTDSNWISDGSKLVPKDSQKVNISNGLTAYYNTQVEQLTDGSFENWTITGYTPDDFGSENPLSATIAQRSTDSHGGTYAILLTADAANGPIYVSDMWANEGAVAEDEATLQIRNYAKRGTGSGNLIVRYLCYDGETEYGYNFSGDNVGTWTTTGGPPSSDMMETLTLTSSYTQVTSTIATIPSEYTDGMALFVAVSSNSGDTVLVDDFELLIDGSDEASNGDFEAWTAVEGLTNWDLGTLGTGKQNIEKESSAVYSGTYAVKMTDNDESRNYVGQLISGTEDETLTASHYARGAAGNAGTVYSVMYFLNDVESSATTVWNKTTTSWEAYTDFDGLDDDNKIFLEVSTSETYTQSSTTLTIPASGKVYMSIYQSTVESDDLMYVDLASETKVTLGYGSLISIDANGKTTFDGQIASSAATTDDDLINLGQLKETGLVLLGSQTVDMTSIAATTIYTATQSALPILILHHCSDIDSLTEAPSFSIGTNSTDYDNYVGTGGSTATIADYVLNSYLGTLTTYPKLSNEDLLKVNVTTGSTATKHEVTFYVFGVLID